MNIKPLVRFVAMVAIPLAVHGPALAQAAPLAAGQVSGAELKAWLEADGMAVAGISFARNCHVMARDVPGGRAQTIYCPGQAPFTVLGEAKVVGDQLCSKFKYPDGSTLDACQDFFKVGDNKYEVRVNGVATSRLYRLVR